MIRRLLVIFLILYIIVPLLMPIIFSFSVFWQDILPQGFTLRWYAAIVTRPRNFSALLSSLIVATGAVLLNFIICVPAAYALNRLETPAGRMLRSLSNVLPLIFPPVIIGTALVQAFSRPPLALTGSLPMVIIAHALIGFPFMFRNTLASFRTIDERTLSEAAASLGANLWQRLRYVIVPNVFPGILAGALLVFAMSIGEFEVTSMVAGFTAQTLPLQLFQQIRNDMRIASAISAFLVYVSVLCFLGMTYLGGRIHGGPEQR
ncbi:MAG: ABC transporter permease [Anaerolineae bacterium]|nr:ABC transporter permease [Anaerolineae bacterium]MDW8102948.1 ABC transporter permease [Anaerolineae bacterium]